MGASKIADRGGGAATAAATAAAPAPAASVPQHGSGLKLQADSLLVEPHGKDGGVAQAGVCRSQAEADVIQPTSDCVIGGVGDRLGQE